MMFGDALGAIVTDGKRDAMKRPSMTGYVFRSAVSDETATAGDYTLTFRLRANSGGNPVDYVYAYDASEDSWKSPSQRSAGSDLALDGELFGLLSADDWQAGRKTDFEGIRVPTGNSRW